MKTALLTPTAIFWSSCRDYFEQTRGSGFDYAYRYPGMNKVLQAAGRVIRTPRDKGVVLLIDNRFAMPDYRRLMPRIGAT